MIDRLMRAWMWCRHHCFIRVLVGWVESEKIIFTTETHKVIHYYCCIPGRLRPYMPRIIDLVVNDVSINPMTARVQRILCLFFFFFFFMLSIRPSWRGCDYFHETLTVPSPQFPFRRSCVVYMKPLCVYTYNTIGCQNGSDRRVTE